MTATDEMVQVLDEDGQVREGATVPDLAAEDLRTIYEQMRFARRLDERAVSLQRQGRMGTYPSLAGQEAAQVAGTHALADDDWLSFQYREHGAVVARGLSHEYLLYWMGHEVGNEWLADRHIFPLNISIAGHLPHLTGMAWASQLQGEDRTFVCHFGDGATSEGDFHEALNFAGVFDVPAVFVCNNNQWAISTSRERQTASATFAEKATAYGFDGVRVDGMDPLAVYAVMREAADKARDPDEGQARPTLVEAVMYRFGAHTTADDPSVYRDEAEVERWKAKDPIPRFETFLRDRGHVDDAWLEAMADRIEERLAALIDAAEAHEGTPTQQFETAYETPTPRVRAQRAEMERLLDEHGHDALTEDE